MKSLAILLALLGLTIAAPTTDEANEATTSSCSCGVLRTADNNKGWIIYGDGQCNYIPKEVYNYDVPARCACLTYDNSVCKPDDAGHRTGELYGPTQGELGKSGTQWYTCWAA